MAPNVIGTAARAKVPVDVALGHEFDGHIGFLMLAHEVRLYRLNHSQRLLAREVQDIGIPVLRRVTLDLVHPSLQLQQVLEVEQRAQVILGDVQGQPEDVTPACIRLELPRDRKAAISVDEAGAVGPGFARAHAGGLKLMMDTSTHGIFLSKVAHHKMRVGIMQ